MKERLSLSLSTSASPLLGGVDYVQGIGQDDLFTFGLSAGGLDFNPGDQLTLNLTNNLTGLLTEVGAGFATGAQPSFVMSFRNKVYALDGDKAFFCAVAYPFVWNDPNGAGNGNIRFTNNYGYTDDFTAMAPFQGKIAFIAGQQVQIWQVDPDPGLNRLEQVLPNIGTQSPQSVQAIGDMDVYMLATSGVRSLRVRDASNNAIISDIGTPIDDILRPILAGLSAAQLGAVCSVVEPSANRYWVYIPNANGTVGDIYVFSYFPSSGIAAWGKYHPTYNVAGTQTEFAPTSMRLRNKQVYLRSGNKVFVYGGADNNTYDACGVEWVSPYIDSGAPATKKQVSGVDVGFEGTWEVYGAIDFNTGVYKKVYAKNASSFMGANQAWVTTGTHYRIKGVETGSGYARFASFMVHIEPADK